jgi:hypothetical protein
MSKHPPDDPRQLFKLLATPLSEFLNYAKLFSSWRMIELVNLSTQKALTSADFHFATQLVTTFLGTPFQAILIRWFEDRSAALVTVQEAKVHIRKRPQAVPRQVHLKDYFPDATRAYTAHIEQQKIALLMAKKRVVLAAQPSDMMDVGRRLPGSFENGKRR